MKYDKNKELEKLEQTNEELVKFMREYPKDKLSLTAIGNSISNGFSMSEPGKLLLDRNIGLIEYGKANGAEDFCNLMAGADQSGRFRSIGYYLQNGSAHPYQGASGFDYKAASQYFQLVWHVDSGVSTSQIKSLIQP